MAHRGGDKHSRLRVSFLVNSPGHKYKGLPELPQGSGRLTEQIENVGKAGTSDEVLKEHSTAQVCLVMTGMDGQLRGLERVTWTCMGWAGEKGSSASLRRANSQGEAQRLQSTSRLMARLCGHRPEPGRYPDRVPGHRVGMPGRPGFPFSCIVFHQGTCGKEKRMLPPVPRWQSKAGGCPGSHTGVLPWVTWQYIRRGCLPRKAKRTLTSLPEDPGRHKHF